MLHNLDLWRLFFSNRICEYSRTWRPGTSITTIWWAILMYFTYICSFSVNELCWVTLKQKADESICVFKSLMRLYCLIIVGYSDVRAAGGYPDEEHTWVLKRLLFIQSAVLTDTRIASFTSRSLCSKSVITLYSFMKAYKHTTLHNAIYWPGNIKINEIKEADM